MARGRMLSKTLSTSSCFARLFDLVPDLAEFAQSLYPLLVAHADDFGREEGDVLTVKYRFHPRSPRSETDFLQALEALVEVGLIQWYEVEGRRIFQIVKFEEHQTGLHKRTRSRFPEPSGTSGNAPELPSQLNLTELKRTEQDQKEQRSAPLSIAEVRKHLRAALHKHLNEHPNTPQHELMDLVKDLSRPLCFTWNTSGEIALLISSVQGQRNKWRTG